MRQQLIQYVNLLFAGSPNSGDMKDEILQNTLDRFDDLIAQGKSEQAAYSLAISGIGDISEVLENNEVRFEAPVPKQMPAQMPFGLTPHTVRRIAIALFIICPIPLLMLGEFGSDIWDTVGLCATLGIIAAATVLLMMSKPQEQHAKPVTPADPVSTASGPISSPRQELNRSIRTAVRAAGLVAFILVSFLTHAWVVTWLIFPICGCINGLLQAVFDYKEAKKHEF